MLSLQVNSEKKLILGSIQLPSFLGKSGKEIEMIAGKARKAASLFAEAGFDGVFIQDTTPGELSLDTISNLAAITRHVRDSVPGIAIGSQMECDNAGAILSTAKAASAEMVRIKNFVGASVRNSGIINGQGPEAIRYRIEHKVETAIFSDIFNLTGVPLGPLSLKKACSMALKLGVEGLIICGPDYDSTVQMLKEVKSYFPDAFLLCGGNATIDKAREMLDICDGVIVSSCLKTGSEFDAAKMSRFISNARP